MTGHGTQESNTTDANPAIAAALSALLPGTGQWYAGRFVRGLLTGVPLVLLIAVGMLAWNGGATGILELAVQPAVIWTLLFFNLVIVIWRVFAVVDAYRISDAGRRGTGTAIVLGALIILVAAPHIATAVYGYRGILLIDRVFVSDDGTAGSAVTLAPPSPEADMVPDPALAAPTTTTTTTTTLPPSTTEPATTTTTEAPPRPNLIFRPGIGDPGAVADRGDIVFGRKDAPFLPFDERVDPGRLTFLLAGGDAGPGRGGLRTDTIMIATVDLDTGQAALFGIPRNMAQIPMPSRFKDAFVDLQRKLSPTVAKDKWVDTNGDGQPDPPGFTPCHCFPEQINAVYPYTRKWVKSYPDEVDPGMAALRDVVSTMTGLHIDYYVLVDMRAFVALVDAVGGVDVYVQKPLQAEVSPPEEGQHWATVDVDVGWHHLSSSEALAYSRARKGSSDYVRMQRQRCLLRAVAAEADPLTMFRSFPAIADAIEKYVVTDVPVSFLPDLVRAAANLDFSNIATVGFNPPYYAPERDFKYHPIPDLGRIRSKIDSVLTEGVVAQSKDGVSECDPVDG
jgi:LCP family protein required for cell wall assembly